ncbi:MAG: hypothetical protein KGZ70_13565 [Hydrogenophaga sp.]|nr:hypothetical protein [Hydrogenophaga sp.]
MLKLNLDYLSIGPAPSEEQCAQVGDDEYSTRSRRETAAYRRQILRHYPVPAECEDVLAGLRICSNPHEFGVYREVEIAYDASSAAACRWAHAVEADPKGVLRRWDRDAIAELGLRTPAESLS